MDKLKKLYLNGFKSFRYDALPVSDPLAANEAISKGKAIEFGDITVLLGPNGAGKSNIVSFFKLLGSITKRHLQQHVAQDGGASSLLHYGGQRARQMQARIDFGGDNAREFSYFMRLSVAAPDALVFDFEFNDFWERGERVDTSSVGTGHVESDLALGYASGHFEAQDGLQQAYKIIYEALRGCKAFQFDNTSSTADIRKSGYIEDASELHADAGNLAAFLYAMQRTYPKYYRRIVETVGLVFPQFGDFDLKPSSANERYILLNWREKKRPDYLFGPHQLSDGTLRFMALTTLLMQPPEKLPRVIIIDEPELGLHPFAITALAGMIHSAATHCQVVISTQSTRLVDEFDVGQIVIVEHDDKDDCTRCRRPDAQALKEWSEEYSTSELWEKNVLGGRP